MSIERPPGYYDELYSEDKRYEDHYSKSKYLQVWTAAMKLIPDSAYNIVELGCGTGQFAQLLLDAGVERLYTGYDFSHKAIELAYTSCKWPVQPPWQFRVADITAQPIPGDFFVCFETLEHTRDFKVIENIGLGKEIVFSLPDFNDPAHVRYFHSINEVVRRYDNHLQFSHIEKIDSWFLAKATTI